MVDFVAPPASYPITGARKKSVADVLRELNLTEFLNGTGIPERTAALNELLNPLAAIPRAQAASQEMFAPNRTGWERTASLGNMLGEVAGVVAPVGLAKATGTPAVNALAEGLTGAQATAGNALAEAGDVGRMFVADESGALRLWHGSPHDFDRFSLDKIGTGEGAQAYGRGLYFAESPDVARQYRDNLAPPQADTGYHNIDVALSRIYGGDWEAFKRDYTGKGLDDIVAEIEAKGGPRITGSSGRVYEAAIDANPEDFLDWDLPLSEQPTAIQLAIEAAGYKPPVISGPKPVDGGFEVVDASGKAVVYSDEQFAKTVSDALAEQANSGGTVLSALGGGEAASNALRNAGIKGIRYLDAGSRGVGEGSRNYVVFDDKLVNVLGKDGQRTTPEGRAQTILDMLQSGRASEVTDDMLDLGDPVANARLNQYLYRNYDLPMDEASRMQRAGEMGFDTGTPLYHGSNADIQAIDPQRMGQREPSFYGKGVYSTAAPDYAGEYARGDGGNILPINARRRREFAWPNPNKNFETHAGAQEFTNRASGAGYSGVRVAMPDDPNFEVVTFDPRNIRSRFARFDPRLAHLKNLSAALIAMGVAPELLLPPEEQPRNALAQY